MRRGLLSLSIILLSACGGSDGPSRTEAPPKGGDGGETTGGTPMGGIASSQINMMGGQTSDDQVMGGAKAPPATAGSPSNPSLGGLPEPGPRVPENSDEARQLIIPFDDPTDPRTVSAVVGLRRLVATGPSEIKAIYGASFSRPGAENNPQAFNIYSPDDDQYALQRYVEPTAVAIEATATDFPAPTDRFMDDPLDRYVVTLSLPTPMAMGKRYFVRGLGGRSGEADPQTQYRKTWSGDPITGGRAGTSLVFGSDSDPNNELDDAVIASVMGLRTVNMVGEGWLRITMGGGGHVEAFKDTANFTLSSENDDRFSAGVSPLEIGIRSATEIVVPGFGYPYPRRLSKTDIYLRFENELANDKTYKITVSDSATTGRRNIEFTFVNEAILNPHLKVNQEGYLPNSKDKLVLLGAWMGTAGTLTFDTAPESCVVVDDETGQEVLRAPIKLRHQAGVEDEGEFPAWRKPGADFTREDVYACDISELKTEGRYFVKVPKMGRSYGFKVSKNAYERAFRVAMRGVFYQRSGQSLDDSNSAYRREAGHVDPVRIPYMENKPIIGGHYDAGDFNPRAHYEVAYDLMMVYALHRSKFFDGQLDIPESANGIPDILDEAAWAIRPFLELQDADGGVGGRDDGVSIESTSDPNFVQTSERDPHYQDSYEKHPRASFILAALGATAARLWSDIGKDDESTRYLNASIRAYEWAVAHLPDGDLEGWLTDSWAWAAAALAHTTGEQKYTADFVRSGYEYAGVFDDGSALRMRAAIAYTHNDHPNADAPLKMLMRDGLNTYNRAMMAPCETYAYPHFQHIYAPVNWGTAAYPHSIHSMVAMDVLGDDEMYGRWMERSANFTLGTNPLNQTWITGLGDNPIYGPMHLFGWHNYQGIMPIGLQSEGPNHDHAYIARYAPYNEPPPAETPAYYNYYDIRYSPGMNEGVVKNMVATAMLFGALLPDR